MTGPVLGLTAASATPASGVRVALEWEGATYDVTLLDIGLACCSLEVMAAALDAGSSRDAGRLPEAAPGTPVDVLVVSGTVTHVLAPLVRRLVESAPGDPVVVSFGACACTGGPYWDSYAVADGVDTVVPVDVYVPGCPPPPEALREAVARAVALRAGAGGAP